MARSVRVSLLGVALGLGLTLALAAAETPVPPMGLAAVDPPTPMAAFTLPGLDGEMFDSAALQDKVVVVRFWATW
jgi:cytochrome oxidase Cu insertion factor (SCO1/SenC/PrrC family)